MDNLFYDSSESFLFLLFSLLTNQASYWQIWPPDFLFTPSWCKRDAKLLWLRWTTIRFVHCCFYCWNADGTIVGISLLDLHSVGDDKEGIALIFASSEGWHCTHPQALNEESRYLSTPILVGWNDLDAQSINWNQNIPGGGLPTNKSNCLVALAVNLFLLPYPKKSILFQHKYLWIFHNCHNTNILPSSSSPSFI